MDTAEGIAAEAKALEQVAHRLQTRYAVPPDEVRAAIAEALDTFAGRPIRDFIPILVEREVAASLDRSQREGHTPTPVVQRTYSLQTS